MHGRHTKQRRPCRFRADCQWPLCLTNALPIHARLLLQQVGLCCNAACTVLQQAVLCCNAACTALQQPVLCCSGGPSGVKPADRARLTSNGADSGRGARRLESYLPTASRRSAALGWETTQQPRGNHAITTRQPREAAAIARIALPAPDCQLHGVSCTLQHPTTSHLATQDVAMSHAPCAMRH